MAFVERRYRSIDVLGRRWLSFGDVVTRSVYRRETRGSVTGRREWRPIGVRPGRCFSVPYTNGLRADCSPLIAVQITALWTLHNSDRYCSNYNRSEKTIRRDSAAVYTLAGPTMLLSRTRPRATGVQQHPLRRLLRSLVADGFPNPAGSQSAPVGSDPTPPRRCSRKNDYNRQRQRLTLLFHTRHTFYGRSLTAATIRRVASNGKVVSDGRLQSRSTFWRWLRKKRFDTSRLIAVTDRYEIRLCWSTGNVYLSLSSTPVVVSRLSDRTTLTS